jgi:hypothetical protein
MHEPRGTAIRRRQVKVVHTVRQSLAFGASIEFTV